MRHGNIEGKALITCICHYFEMVQRLLYKYAMKYNLTLAVVPRNNG